MGTLYVVGIPKDNLEDTTLRALRVLREVDLVATQDPSRVQEFLTCHGIDTPVARIAVNERESKDVKGIAGKEVVLDALRSGDVALLFETAGAATSDPTRRLVRAAVEEGCAVVAVPGPSTTVTALVTSGLPADAYLSLDFLPQRAVERRRLLTSVARERQTLVTFERDSNLTAALCDMVKILGNRPLVLLPVRADSYEGAWRGTLSEAAAQFETNSPGGEWALVIGGATGEATRWPEDRVRSELARLLAGGLSHKTAAQRLAKVSGWRSREVYRLAEEGRFRV